MIVTSRSQPPLQSSLAAMASSAATLGIEGMVRSALPDSERERREPLRDLRLDEPIREVLDKAVQAGLDGSVIHEPVDSEIGRQLKLQYTVIRTPKLEIILLQIPAWILQDGNQIDYMHSLNYVLRSKFVRVLSPNMTGYPSPAFNGIKRIWREDNIQMEFVPASHIEELKEGKADLGNVLRLDLCSTPAVATDPNAAPAPAPPLQKIRIFLASSCELRDDRDDFELYFRQKNDEFVDRGFRLEIERWENFLDAMSDTRLQDEYNKEIEACDIFVSLFFTKAGKYTEEEFDTAHKRFKETGKPKIFTFFKNAPVNMNAINDEVMSLVQFKKKLGELGHFYTSYDNIEHLKRQFRDQLAKLQKELH